MLAEGVKPSGAIGGVNLDADGNLRSYVPRNSGMKIRIGPKATGDLVLDTYQPRTELGRKLMAIRRAYVFAGGELLTPDALEAEIRSRRGGVGNV